MMKKEQIKIFENPKETAKAFGDYLMSQVAKKKTFHCALSGGSTPKLLFDYLAESHQGSPLWSQIHFYWGDERCVPPEDDESNYKMTKKHLLDHVAIPEQNIHRVKGEREPHREAERYSRELMESMPVNKDKPVFDLIILGMGNDGHTASIFPHQMELLNSDLVCDVATHPESGQKRVTLTGSVINAAKEVVFLVTGAGKKEKLDEILNQKGDWESYPAAHISPAEGRLLWFLDKQAGGTIK